MSETLVRITPRDPLLFGDGRPFADEDGAFDAVTRSFPLPGTLAGMLRTRIGHALNYQWPRDAARAREIEVGGPLLQSSDGVLFPAPADALGYKGQEDATVLAALRPWGEAGVDGVLPAGAGSDLPTRLTPIHVPTQNKPVSGATHWPAATMWRWLSGEAGATQPPPVNPPFVQVEMRTHLRMNAESGTGMEGHLFTTQGLTLGRDTHFLARFNVGEPVEIAGFAPFGGEKRLAEIETERSDRWPDCPDALREHLGSARLVRMALATPALFAAGWRPGWLDDELIGSPPFAPGLVLKLVSAIVRRREAVSGWDYEKRSNKRVRWLAPAGSVYFFQVLAGEPATLSGLAWLTSVCDDHQDRLDGYGLALWGIWDYARPATGIGGQL